MKMRQPPALPLSSRRGRCDVGLAMIHAIACLDGRALSSKRRIHFCRSTNADFDGMDLSIVCARNKSQTVLVTDQLSDLREYFSKIPACRGEINAASIRLRNCL